MEDKKALEEELLITIFANVGITYINNSFIPNNSLYHKGLALLTPILGIKAISTIHKLKEEEIERNQIEKRKELLSLYKEFLTRYKELNNTLELNNPIEIFTLFEFLLFKGYISHKGYFLYTNKELKDIETLTGLDVINGKGLCRNISSLFCEILKESNIKTEPLIVSYKESKISIKEIEQETDKEKIFNLLKDRYFDDNKLYETYHSIINKIPDDKGIEISFSSHEKLPFIYNFIGNHMISYSYYNDNNYFLDPTNYKIYHLHNNKKELINYEGFIPIRFLETKHLMNKIGDYEDLLPIIKSNNKSLSKEEELELIEKTKNKYKMNMDILLHFYSRNIPLYNDISKVLEKTKVEQGRII